MSFFNRLRKKDDPLRSASITPVDPATLPFGVGDIVRDVWGNEHTVFEIDPEAEHGIGLIRTRRLSDGVVLGTAMMAHDFTLVRRGGHNAA
ncbi:MAG TPA: hypothetical protein VFM25_01590 [Verrucomicrobiae bacterium]|nr:hypothetical protein [Verrucomicrobiae bacterium]